MIKRLGTPRGCATLMVFDGVLLAWLALDTPLGALAWASDFFGFPASVVFVAATAGMAAWLVALWDGRMPHVRLPGVRVPNMSVHAPRVRMPRLRLSVPFRAVWPQRRYKRYGAYVARRRAMSTPSINPSPRASEVTQNPRYRIRSAAEAVAEAQAAQAAAASARR